MKRWFMVTFKSEADHDRFMAWLPSWESENEDTEAKIRFVRMDGQFSGWTLHVSDERHDELLHAAAAFNGALDS